MVGRDLLHQGQSHACAVDLGGEEGVTDPVQVSIDHAAARIGDGDGCGLLVPAAGDGQLPPVRHGFHGIADEVDKQLLDMAVVHVDQNRLARQVKLVADLLFFQLAVEEHQAFTDQGLQLLEFLLRLTGIHVDEQVFQGLFDPARFLLDNVQEAVVFGMIEFAGQHSGNTADGGDGIAQGMDQLR